MHRLGRSVQQGCRSPVVLSVPRLQGTVQENSRKFSAIDLSLARAEPQNQQLCWVFALGYLDQAPRGGGKHTWLPIIWSCPPSPEKGQVPEPLGAREDNVGLPPKSGTVFIYWGFMCLRKVCKNTGLPNP